jgi:hypothetical protein
MSKKAKLTIIGVGILGGLAAVGAYTWSETKEIRLCLSLYDQANERGRVPATIEEVPASVHRLQWDGPEGFVTRGERSVPAGATMYTLVCDPARRTCSLNYEVNGRSSWRSYCVHPGHHEATDYF